MSFDRKARLKTEPNRFLPLPLANVHHYGMTDLGICWCQVHRREVRLKGEKIGEGTAGVIAEVTHCVDEANCEKRAGWVEDKRVSCLVGKRIEAKW